MDPDKILTLRVTLRTACFGLVVRDGRIVGGAPYGLAMLRRMRISGAREAWRFFTSIGGKCERLG